MNSSLNVFEWIILCITENGQMVETIYLSVVMSEYISENERCWILFQVAQHLPIIDPLQSHSQTLQIYNSYEETSYQVELAVTLVRCCTRSSVNES